MTLAVRARAAKRASVLAILLIATGPLATIAGGVPLGLQLDAIPTLPAGAMPRYGSYWVGAWMATSGWGDLDSALDVARQTGTVPVLYWYYWGDSISPACVERGCDGRTLEAWMRMTDTLAEHVRDKMDGNEVLIVLENEFNKGGITGDYAITFDALLESVALKLKAVEGVRIVLGFGAWGEASWTKFPKAVAQSDLIGFQLMRASTRDSEESYRGAVARTTALVDFVSRTFGKPSFLYDLALSSYPDASWTLIQAETLAGVLAAAGDAGLRLEGVVYRALRDDPSKTSGDYFGPAEARWGLKNAPGGEAKPAWAVWLAAATGSG